MGGEGNGVGRRREWREAEWGNLEMGSGVGRGDGGVGKFGVGERRESGEGGVGKFIYKGRGGIYTIYYTNYYI